MANRAFNNLQGLNPKLIIIAGKFSIAASGGVATKLQGYGFTVAKSDTGEYTITLDDSYPASISTTFSLEADTAVDLVPQIKSVDVNTSKEIIVNLNTGAVPTEPSAVTIVNFILVLQNTSLPSV